jgi:hypothetical protein
MKSAHGDHVWAKDGRTDARHGCVSAYAGTNALEDIAETFAAVMSLLHDRTRTHPRPLLDAVGVDGHWAPKPGTRYCTTCIYTFEGGTHEHTWEVLTECGQCSGYGHHRDSTNARPCDGRFHITHREKPEDPRIRRKVALLYEGKFLSDEQYRQACDVFGWEWQFIP